MSYAVITPSIANISRPIRPCAYAKSTTCRSIAGGYAGATRLVIPVARVEMREVDRVAEKLVERMLKRSGQ